MVLEWAGRELPPGLRDGVPKRLREAPGTQKPDSMLQSSCTHSQTAAMGGLWKEEGFLLKEYRKEGALDNLQVSKYLDNAKKVFSGLRKMHQGQGSSLATVTGAY